MKPTIGRTVIYNLTEEDNKLLAVNIQGRYNNSATALPAIVVAVWSESTVNLQVIVDGNIGTMWKTSIVNGDGPGQWNWPKIEKPEEPKL